GDVAVQRHVHAVDELAHAVRSSRSVRRRRRGGGPGIRTQGDGVAATAVFKTAALGHYASPPGRSVWQVVAPEPPPPRQERAMTTPPPEVDAHRMNVYKQVPNLYKAMLALNVASTAGLDPILVELTRIRASQINHCAFCLDMHVTAALEAGEDPRRLHLVA